VSFGIAPGCGSSASGASLRSVTAAPVPSRTVVITFLSDYGLEDDFVGVCHAVMARIAPAVRVVDLTHAIPRHDVATAALVLRRTLPYAPPGVHLAVVDPEVGGSRRAVALRCAEDDRLLVGPDSGLLLPAAEAFGGVVEAVELSRSPHRLEPVSATSTGATCSPRSPPTWPPARPWPARATRSTRPSSPHLASGGGPVAEADRLVATVTLVDRFGNLTLDATHADVVGLGLRVGRRVRVDEVAGIYVRTFADVAPGGLLLYEDPYGALAVAVRDGSAAERLGRQPGDELVLRAGP
jgi:S-adenosylmethionine hydrolase